jgi:Arc/MetJ-type ribon-helix-helix transcriptional regulator
MEGSDLIARKGPAMKTLKIEIPDRVYEEIEILVKDGWFRDREDIIQQALRRFLDSHRPELMERFIRQDVERGLRGKK